MSDIDLQDAKLGWATLNDTLLAFADLREVQLTNATLEESILLEADLTDANCSRTNLTNADLINANLTDVSLEGATLIGTNLFDADLTRIKPYGARFSAVQINDGTEFNSDRSGYTRWWHTWSVGPPARCGYDISLRECGKDSETRKTTLSKAADTYKQFEELGRENTRPSIQSTMFVLRQEMQRKRDWMQGRYHKWLFSHLSRQTFKHGESLARIMLVALLLIVGYASLYKQYDLILAADTEYIQSGIDALYFSTLTFTTLGLGDFQPDPASEVARMLVTSQAAIGAILIATFVFVLGRRAAR